MSPGARGALEAGPSLELAAPERALEAMVGAGRSFSGRERNCCFLNTGGPRFANVSAVTGLDFPDDGRAIGVADWDLDGDLDLWIVNRTAPQVRFLRNDWPRHGRFLSLRLAGTKGNRDAIGARVEVRTRTPQGEIANQVRSLRAGEGFLAQSSKWLHFGLGEAVAIERVAVRWPAGAVEEFSGIEPDGRYRLGEGEGRAQPWSPPAAAAPLVAGAPELPPDSAGSHIFLSAPVPIPPVRYRGPDGKPAFAAPGPRGLVVNLWSAQCTTCGTEWTELGRRAADLSAAGLTVLALSVDALADGKAPAAEETRAWLAERGAAPPFGWVDPAFLDRLERYGRELFGLHRPFPVPTTLLLDPEGRLSAICRGPLDIDRLIADAGALDADLAARRARAVPFPGVWIQPPTLAFTRSMVDRFLQEDYLEGVGLIAREILRRAPDDPEALFYSAMVAELDGKIDEAIRQYEALVHATPKWALPYKNLGTLWLEKRRPDRAIECFGKALELLPKWGIAHHNLGVALEGFGRFEEAARQYRAALEAAPELNPTRVNLGRTLLELRKTADAEEVFREALRRNPKFTEARYNLALALMIAGKLTESADELATVLMQEPRNPNVHYARATVLARQGKVREAVEHLRTVLQIHPKYPRAAEDLRQLERALAEPR